MHHNRQNIKQTARHIVAQRPLFLDTETTGIDGSAEIVDIALLDTNGAVLLESLVKPVKRIPAAATAIHGITNAAVAKAPTLAELWPQLEAHVTGRTLAIYNAEYDIRLLWQSLKLHKLEKTGLGRQLQQSRLKGTGQFCIMKLYAEYAGQWNSSRGSYKWHKLAEAARQCGLTVPAALHRAKVDTELARQVLLTMGGYITEHGELPLFTDEESQIQAAFDEAGAEAHRFDSSGRYGL
jgi:DNA polymerase-3 subunit epsilon